MSLIAGWGRRPVVEGRELLGEDLERLCPLAGLSRGLGRSYGDASLPPRPGVPVLCTRMADRVLAFDAERGVLRAEAGLALDALQALVVPRGFCCPVLPGTGRVTLGGMVAADVHGKDHPRAGSLGAHVRALRIVVADGRALEIGPRDEGELFAATLGGLGLTGHVTEVELQLARVPSATVWAESHAAADLEGVLAGLRGAAAHWPFATAWVDALGGAGRLRGVVHAGRWAERGETAGRPPLPPPALSVPARSPRLAGRLAVGAYNALLFGRHSRRPRRGACHAHTFFHPLDTVARWNRLYGERGFVQHQCVLPDEAGDGAVARLFEALARSGVPTLLAVLKVFGAQGRGLLSFPRPGITVALDLPYLPQRTQAAVDALNEVVIAAGGRVYLAKDALSRREHIAAMEGPRLDAFARLRRAWDPEGRLSSALAVRLLGDEP